jgi:hypothetical protein
VTLDELRTALADTPLRIEIQTADPSLEAEFHRLHSQLVALLRHPPRYDQLGPFGELLTQEATPAPIRPCESCGEPEQLVPPAKFWYACPACHPATFTRK